jgi:hypothetical protein
MRFALDLPNTGVCGDARVLAELAHIAEDSGWDGVFVWDSVHVKMDDPHLDGFCDPWIALTAMALATSRVALGPMILPLPRRRPWKVARETVSLDRLSGGRLVLPVGLGAVDDGAFSKVGEPLDRPTRAARLDESLAILNGLWSGQPFSFAGQHYKLEEMTFLPPPAQSPRIPVWVVGAWPRLKSMRRALQWDGVLPFKMGLTDGGNTFALGLTPDDIRAIKQLAERERGPDRPFEIVLESDTPGDDPARAADLVRPYAEAGVTWWVEAIWKLYFAYPGDVEVLKRRIKQGPTATDWNPCHLHNQIHPDE